MRHVFLLFVVLCLPLQWVWAGSTSCKTNANVPANAIAQGSTVFISNALIDTVVDRLSAKEADTPQNRLPYSLVVQDIHPILAELARWEADADDKFGILAQIQDPVWDDMAEDNLSCHVRVPESKHSKTQLPDPQEVDIPFALGLNGPMLADTLFMAAQHPPRPAPVFRAYRPPSLTA